MPAVFISYSRHDKPFVQRLHDALRARKYDVWVDWEDIPPSAEWLDEIQAGVRGADGFIYVISPDSVSSAVCTKELDSALAQNKRVVPVVYREPDGATVPEQAAALNWVFLRDTDDFDAGLTTLLTALETDLDHVRVHTRLGVQANRWDTGKRDKSLLLRGSELAAAEQWLAAGAGKRPEATQLQREYLLASRQAATQRQRTLIGGVSVALVVAVALAVVAVVQRSSAVHEKNVAVARQLDADALSNYTTDPELSVLLAIKAAQVQPNAQSETALREALAQSNIRARYPLTTSSAGDVVWSPTGKRLLMTSPGLRPDDWARIYTPGSSAPPIAMPGPSTSGSSGWDAAGNRVVIGGGLPAVYDAATGHLIRQFTGPAIRAALLPDGNQVVIVNATGMARVYAVTTGRLMATFQPHDAGGTTCFALSPNGRYAAQCDAFTAAVVPNNPGALDVWSTATGRLLRSIAAPTLIGSVAFSPDSARLVYTITNAAKSARPSLAAENQAAGAAGTLVYNTVGHGGPVITFNGGASAAAFGPSAKYESVIWATTSDDTAHVYEFYNRLEIPLTGATDIIDTVSFDETGAYVLTAGADGVIRIYNPSAGGPPLETLAGHTAEVPNASFGDGAEYVASSANDGTTLLWQGPTPIPSRRRLDAPLGGDGAVESVGFSRRGDRIIVAGGGYRPSAQGRILNASDLSTAATFTVPAGQYIGGAVISRDGGLLVALTAHQVDGRFVGDAIDSFNGHTGARLAAITPGDGQQLLNASLNYAGTELATMESAGHAELWNPRTGRLLHVLSGATTDAQAIAFSPDDSLLGVVHDPTLPAASTVTFRTTLAPVVVQLWNTRTGALERTIQAQPLQPQIPGDVDYAPLAIAFSPDGKLLALSGSEPDVQLFDPSTGAAAHAPLHLTGGFSGGVWAGTLAFSPDGRRLAAGTASSAYVWSVPQFGDPEVFQAVPAGALAEVSAADGVHVGFSLDSQYLDSFATTTATNTLEARYLPDDLEVFQISSISAGSLAPDATKLVTTSIDGGVSVYPCQLCGGLKRLLALAEHRVTRGFTPAERKQYLTPG